MLMIAQPQAKIKTPLELARPKVPTTVSSILATGHKTEYYKNHIEEINKYLRDEIQKRLLTSSIELTEQFSFSLNDNHYTRHLNKFEEFPDDVRIWPNQIKTFVDILFSLLENPSKSKCIIGATQLGKSGLMLLCRLHDMIMWARTGRFYKTLLATPPMINLSEQTTHDLEIMSALYNLKIELTNGQSVTYSPNSEGLRDYEEIFKSHIVDKLPKTLQIDFSEGKVTLLRRENTIIKKYKELVKAFVDEDVKLIILIDECHWGSEEKFDEKGKPKRTSSLAQFIDLAPRLYDGDIIMVFSATAFNFSGLKDMDCIYCQLYKDYVGYDFWGGKNLDEAHVAKYPELISLQSISILEFVDKDLYHNSEKYDKKYENSANEMTHEEYVEFCDEKIIDFIHYYFFKDNPKNSKGFLFRFFKTNQKIKEFIDKNKHKFDPRIKLVPWCEKNSKLTLDEYFLSHNIEQDDYKLILISAGARMGARIPDKHRIYYAIDFSNTTNIDTILQGVLGRLTGRKSEAPTVFLKHEVFEAMNAYVESKGLKFTINPSKRSKVSGLNIHGRSYTISFIENAQNRNIIIPKEIFQDLATWTRTYQQGHKIALRRGKMPGKIAAEGFQFIHNIIDYVERQHPELKGSFLRYHSDDQMLEKNSLFLGDDKAAYMHSIGFRDQNKWAVRNSNKGKPIDPTEMPTTRERPTNAKEIRQLVPQIIVKLTKQGWKLVAMKICFRKNMNCKIGQVLPTNKDVAAHTKFNDDSND